MHDHRYNDMKSDPCIQIFDDKEGMTSFLLNKWSEMGLESIARKGSFTAALSGGTTPLEFYRALAAKSRTFPWARTHIFLADERFVPFSDRDSNYGMLNDLLLSHVGIPATNIHAVRTDLSSLSEAADQYGIEMRRFFGLHGNEVPEFDFIGLGIGGDGHTASLFPGSPEAEVPLVPEKKRLAVALIREGVKHPRISLTLTVINNAKSVVFIVTGRDKAAIVKRVAEERDPGFPASRVAPYNGTLTFVLDSEAASMLNR
jgi:6-phosphogluconolactonase